MARKKAATTSTTSTKSAKKKTAKKKPVAKRTTSPPVETSSDSLPRKGRTKRSAKTAGGKVNLKARVSGLANLWKKSRESVPTAMGVPDIPDGCFCGQIHKASIGETQAKKPYFRIEFLLRHGDYEGTSLTKMYMLTDDPVGDSGKTQLDLFSEDLQRLGIEVKEMEAEDLFDLPTFLTNKEENENAETFYSLRVVNKEDRNGKPRLNVYINGALEPEEVNEWEDEFDEVDED